MAFFDLVARSFLGIGFDLCGPTLGLRPILSPNESYDS